MAKFIKNTWPGDLALIELQRDGKTAAPRDVLQALAARGHLKLTARGPALTEKGRDRAQRLTRDPAIEHDLRLRFAPAAAGGGLPMRTVGGGGAMHL